MTDTTNEEVLDEITPFTDEAAKQIEKGIYIHGVKTKPAVKFLTMKVPVLAITRDQNPWLPNIARVNSDSSPKMPPAGTWSL